jgi:hypothetical protein
LLIPLLFVLAAACGSSSEGSLQGGASFVPNAVLAAKPVLAGGTVGQNLVAIYLTASSPDYSCMTLDAGYPDSGSIQGEVKILVAQNGVLTAGTYTITDGPTFYVYVADGGSGAGLAAIGQSAPLNSGADLQNLADSVSGSLSLTQTGNAWAGTFSATMTLANDGGLTLLSGNFYTGTICYLNDY